MAKATTTGYQHIISSAYTDQIMISDDGTIRDVEASHGDTIKAAAGSDTTLNFATYLNGSASSITVGATDEQSSLNFANDAKSVTLFNINQFVNVNELVIRGADGSTVTGNAGDNTLTGHGDVTKLYGEDGNDDLTSHGVNSLLEGGEGDDTITSHGDQTILRGDAGNDNVTSYGYRSSLKGGEGNDDLTSYGDDTDLRGGDGNDDLKSYGNNSLLEGGDGYDTFEAYGNNNRIKAHSNNTPANAIDYGEIASFAHFGAAASVHIDLSTVSASQFGGDGVWTDIELATGEQIYQHYYGFHNVTGTGGDDEIVGDYADNILDGNGGKDKISGGGGNDTITVETVGYVDGGDGIDSLLVTGNTEIYYWGDFRVKNIEILEVSNTDYFQLTSSRIQSMTDLNNTLIINGDEGAILTLVEDHLNTWESDMEGYTVYGTEDFTLYVDNDMTVTLTGSINIVDPLIV